VIEHVQFPVALLGAIRSCLDGSPGARVFFETPTVEWILKNNVIWDFFYEHCSYFSVNSMQSAFQVSGYKVASVKEVFGGQYILAEAAPADKKPSAVFDPADLPGLADAYLKNTELYIQSWKEKLLSLKKNGKTALWGAGAKGATFANLIDPDTELLACVIDINPKKQGKFLSGSGHLITDLHVLQKEKIEKIVVMNPNYKEEIDKLLKKEGIKAEFVK
jgi:hypothetical protein